MQNIFGIGIFLAAVYSAALGGQAFAGTCTPIQKDIRRLDKKLSSLMLQLSQYESNIVATENHCQRAEVSIAQNGASSSTAESCVAFKETAELNSRLTKKSEACSAKIDTLRKNTENFSSTVVSPFQTSMHSISKMHLGMKAALPECADFFAQSREMHEQSINTVNKARALIEKAQKDIQHFTELGNKTRSFSKQSQAASDQCGTSGSIVTNAMVAPPQPPSNTVKVLKGHSSRPGSTITGAPKEEKDLTK